MAGMSGHVAPDKRVTLAQEAQNAARTQGPQDLAKKGAEKVAREGGIWSAMNAKRREEKALKAARRNSKAVRAARFAQAEALAVPKSGGPKA